MDYIIYEDTPKYSTSFKIIPLLLSFIAATLGANLIATDQEHKAVFMVIGIVIATIPMAIFLWALLPHKYRIFDDKLKILMGWPFSFNIPFDSIETAREATVKELWARNNTKFATCFSNENTVLIVRTSGSNISITPGNREEFLRHLNKALGEWKSKTKVDDKTNRMQQEC